VRALVDRRLSESGLAAVEEYRKTWSEHLDIRGELEAIGSDPRGLERDRDMLAFQIAEIDDASLGPEEEEALRRDLTRLRNAEELGSDANRALTALGDDGLSDHAAQAVEALRSAEAIDPSLTSLTQRVEALATEASDIAGELALYMSDTQADPQHLDELEHRLSLINILKRKYGDTIEDILTFRKGAGVREQALSDLLTAAEDIDERREASLAAVHGAGETLRQHRTIAAEHIASNAVTHLGDLGFSDPVVRIEITGTDPGADGADRATVVFASDVSLAPGPVSSIASGGELSRLVLALTLAAGTAEASVVAFDEIDAGVGGSTALAMGRKLADLARDRQVICVTHLPQVAAYADTHLAVTRSGQTAAIDLLAADERLTELTRMLAGLSDSSTGRDHAEELLAIAAAHS
jgi:DNA repair protein RecN (Recombination protein N)